MFAWNDTQVGLLIGLPVLTGSLMRLPLGMTTCWMFFAALALVRLAWLHFVVRRIMTKEEAVKV